VYKRQAIEFPLVQVIILPGRMALMFTSLQHR
jgi:hypothetical protein